MDYYFSKVLECSVNEGIEKVTLLLKDEGFGIITQIDVKHTLKEKIGVEFREYVILGACNPGFAFNVLSTEDKIGLFLPCNVVVQDIGDGKCEIAAINPKSTISSVGNSSLTDMSCKVTEIMDRVIRKLE
ncbi:MAG: DUF302 domain-containing protein [Bacteroidales bacterium]|mgnify:CR=1 FL=1|nr:DUF302 domain-containing protein [Bacteroidales bacterium]MBK9359448.1 DUF302 domain-containing protein [Bacteroidales bacterium]